jgi:putative membrane protein
VFHYSPRFAGNWISRAIIPRVDEGQDHRGEVDARFLLANERTLLAWVRTGLTLMAAGIAARQFGKGVERHLLVTQVLLLLGTLAVVAGGTRYLAADRAIRQGRLPSTGTFPLVLVGSVALVGASLMVASAVSG